MNVNSKASGRFRRRFTKKEACIDVIRGACVSGFNVSSLELERGPFVVSLDEIKNLNGKTQYLGQCPDINIISPISPEILNSVILW